LSAAFGSGNGPEPAAPGRDPAAMPPKLSLLHAVVLGLAQGPSEVLPVSSSAHTALIPSFAGWAEAELDAEARNSLEAALHAGAGAALLIALRGGTGCAAGRRSAWRLIRRLNGRAAATAATALLPPACAGYLLERRLERRPGTPRAFAAGLALGGAAMALADSRRGTRTAAEAGPRDGLAIGFAQTLALLPGVSRNGATLTAARARRFTREDAALLSWRSGLPVIAGAGALKAFRLARRGAPPGAAVPLAASAGAAFLSTLASAPLIGPGRRARALWPFALYRLSLASVVFRRFA
jgi:undecaprenyl-diphosphatase